VPGVTVVAAYSGNTVMHWGPTMILRIARFSVAAREEEIVVAGLRAQTGLRDRPEGLEDLVFAIGRPTPGIAEFVTVTLWTDMAAIERALGAAVNAPGGLTDIADRIEGKRVEHLDVFADDWPELVSFLEMPLQVRREATRIAVAGRAEVVLKDSAALAAIV
jgi:hypothetical protein